MSRVSQAVFTRNVGKYQPRLRIIECALRQEALSRCLFEIDTVEILLMEEILHQLIGRFSHHLQGFIHPRWCRISFINSTTSSCGVF